MTDEDCDLVMPFVGSPPHVVEAALNLAELSPNDVLLDLGCGDGRLCLAAAERGARAVGVDISHERVAMARLRAEKCGEQSSKLCSFEVTDVLHTDFTIPDDVTVIYIFSSPALVAKLQLKHCLDWKLRAALRAGARIITYGFPWHIGEELRLASDKQLVQRESRRGDLQMTKLELLVKETWLSDLD